MTEAEGESFVEQARRIVDANRYLTLSTADAGGRPWVTPVYFTPDGERRFLWVSSPDARHSRNIAERADVALVIYDTTVPIGRGEAVYFAARAGLVADADVEQDAAVFNAPFGSDRRIALDELRGSGPLRLYEAVVSEASVLLRGGDPRNLNGIDTRVVID